MKTLEQINKEFKQKAIDGRDLSRLARFIPYSYFPCCGIELREETTEEEWNKRVIPFTRENILTQIEKDLAFAFEKALNERGISSALMYDVIRMWNWILEEGLEDFDEYPMYGLPLFEATAEKYGFNNPVKDD